MTTIRPQDEN